MDDFDDLLNEVEKDLESQKLNATKLPRCKRTVEKDEDIDSILNDDDDVINFSATKKKEPSSITYANRAKCKILFIGGSKTPSGVCSITSKRSCDKLRCTSCDFKVEQFNDFEWMDSVDYLFLRNNMPDFKRVSSKLKRKPGSRAYACQCSWKSAKVLTKLNHSSLKWVCGKH